MAGGSTGFVPVYYDDVDLKILSGTYTKITESDLPTLSGVGKEFVGWYDDFGVEVVAGDYWNLHQHSSSGIYLYSKWNYETVAVDGQILRDIANAIRTQAGLDQSTAIRVTDMASLIEGL